MLELLTSEGFVQRIDLGSGVSRYEPVRSSGDHHHHLVCDSCGKVEAFEDRALEQAIHRLEEDSGYVGRGARRRPARRLRRLPLATRQAAAAIGEVATKTAA